MMSLFLIAEYSIVYTYHNVIIHSSVEGRLDCFQFLAIMNKAAMNIVKQVSLWCGGALFGYMPISVIAQDTHLY